MPPSQIGPYVPDAHEFIIGSMSDPPVAFHIGPGDEDQFALQS
ncbi:hypothetical protein [Paraburkholderia sp. SIMBA_054]